jgi:hypothetical protein
MTLNSDYSFGMASQHDLVLLVNVGDNGEASVLRSYLEHHGIHVYVKGENHRSLLGMVGTYIDLGVMVPGSQIDDARELYAAYQNGGNEAEGAEPPEMRGVNRDQFPDEDEDEDDESWLSEAEINRLKKRAVLAAFILPIGGAHYSIGAYGSGLLLSGISIYSVVHGVSNPMYFGIWAAAIVMDLFASRFILKSRK